MRSAPPPARRPGGPPVSVLHHLEATGGFFRDTRLGGLLHPGKVSLREVGEADTLHICLGDGNRVSVHLDRVSPLVVDGSGRHRYSPVRVVAHVASDVVTALVRAVSGRRHEGHCELVCEVVETSDAGLGPAAPAVGGAAGAGAAVSG